MSSCGTTATYNSSTGDFTVTATRKRLYGETRVTLTDPSEKEVAVLVTPDNPVEWSELKVTVPLWPHLSGIYSLKVSIGVVSPCVDASDHKIERPGPVAFRVVPDPAMVGSPVDLVAVRDGYAFPAEPTSVELVGVDVLGKETSRVPLTAVTVRDEGRLLSAVLPSDISVGDLTSYAIEVDHDASQRGTVVLIASPPPPGTSVELRMTGFTARKETHDPAGVFGSPGDEVALQYLEYQQTDDGDFVVQQVRWVPPDQPSWNDVEEGRRVKVDYLLSTVRLPATVVGVPVLWEMDGSPDVEMTDGLSPIVDDKVKTALTEVVREAAGGADVTEGIKLEGLRFYRPKGWWPVGRKGDRPIGFTNEHLVIIDGQRMYQQSMTPKAVVISPLLAPLLQKGPLDLTFVFAEGDELGEGEYELHLELKLSDTDGQAPVRLVAPRGSINPDGYDVNGDEGPGEYVLLVNSTDQPVDLSGWKIQDLAGNSIDLPDESVLAPRGELRVYTGPGPATSGGVHVGRKVAFLTNTGDLLMLLDADGRPVHQLRTPAE